MTRVKLKRLLDKKETVSILNDLIDALDTPINIQDVEGNLLLGAVNDDAIATGKHPVKVEGEILGWVVGGKRAGSVAALLAYLASKAAEERILANEVLILYREINLLYKLSEKLSASLELGTAARLALDEANRLIKASGGSVLLLNEHSGKLETIATLGQEFQPQTSLKLGEGIIGEVAQTGKAEIVNNVRSDARCVEGDNRISSLVCAPLKAKQRVIGVVVLFSATPTGYTAGDLKLLNVLASQAAPAIENALLYERTVREAADYNRILEHQVQERTRELQAKNVELEDTLQQLQDIQNQMVLQQKLAPLGVLTAGIAHEIRNPLNFVNNFADLSVELTQELRQELTRYKELLDAETFADIQDIFLSLEQNMQKITEHGRRADRIVQGMLQHSRGQAGTREPTDLNALLAEYVHLAYHGMQVQDASFHITIETAYDPSIGLVEMVPQDMSRVFLNLLTNACYAVQEKYKALGTGFSPTLWVRTTNRGERVEIRIRDNGNGIPPEMREKIFQPFFTTKPAGAGTGLGLSISHDIVRQGHKGEINVDTEVGKYTEFIITLPKQVH